MKNLMPLLYPFDADCDPADCNSVKEPTENADNNAGNNADNNADNSSADAYYNGYGVDCAPADSESARDSGVSDLSELYGNDYEQDNAETDYPEYETSEYDSGAESANPEDELAATCDDCECTVSARQNCALDDYEIISDVLGEEKQLVKLYSTALCESAEEPLRNVIRENLSECAKDQFATFEFMEKRGLYQLEEAEEQDVAQAVNQFGPLCEN